jgi:hypothetical protein
VAATFFERDPRRRAFLEWELLDHTTRSLRKEPKTQKDWCASFEVPERTVANWKKHEEFQAEVARRTKQMTQVFADAGVEAIPDTGLVLSGELAFDDDIATEMVKSKVLAAALAGDIRSQDLWAKSWGKQYISTAADHVADHLRELSDEQLAAQIAELSTRLLELAHDDEQG